MQAGATNHFQSHSQSGWADDLSAGAAGGGDIRGVQSSGCDKDDVGIRKEERRIATESSSSRTELFQEGTRLLAAGKIVECADLSFRVLELAQAAGDQVMVMGLHGGLGACFRKMGKYSRALEHAQHQLVIAQVLDLQLGQAQAKNGIALALTELGDMEGSRRNLEEALQHCYSVMPAGCELVQQQSALFLCTTLANLADHSVRVGQFKDAMSWVRKLEHVDTEYIDPHSQQVWAARAAGILESIHKRLGTSPMHNTEMPERNDVEEMQA